jgi:hypothetical protein
MVIDQHQHPAKPPHPALRWIRKHYFPIVALLVCTGTAWLYWVIADPFGIRARSHTLSYWMDRAFVENDDRALITAISTITEDDPADKARIGREFRARAIKALKVKDNKLWKPYNTLWKMNLPILGRLLPQWREPAKVRLSAAELVYTRCGTAKSPQEVLAVVARGDPKALHLMLSWSLVSFGIVTEADEHLVLFALTDPNPSIRGAAVRWFTVAKSHPDSVVPILVKGLEDNSMRSAYADALKVYGSKARLAVPSLLSLSATNDTATASTAAWVLACIDPEGAGKQFQNKFGRIPRN